MAENSLLRKVEIIKSVKLSLAALHTAEGQTIILCVINSQYGRSVAF